MKRREFLQQTALTTTAGLMFGNGAFGQMKAEAPSVRIAEGERKFKSASVEKAITDVKKNVGNREIARLFENCFPNTLDTTVDFEVINGKPDTFVITGDIDAMWLRDSSAQVFPYLAFVKEDKPLRELIKGVLNRQTRCILKDSYANAFYKDETKISEWKADETEMKPGVHERKWEIDSLCYPIRLAFHYWRETGDISAFDRDWTEAMRAVVKTFQEQQRLENIGSYKFQRRATNPIDSVPLNGYGFPTKKVGLIHAMFRPSDDSTIFPFLIPSNFFAKTVLGQLRQILATLSGVERLKTDAGNLENAVGAALEKYAVVNHPQFGKIYAYEVDGFGNALLMDDANVPSLLGLPYLDAVKASDPVYQNTRKFVLSSENPYFFQGRAAEGVGGPHVGIDYVWHLGIIVRALTSDNNREIKACLEMLQKTHAQTYFMHESFHKDDAAKFTRKWFAWANTLFGELILKTYRTNPRLLS